MLLLQLEALSYDVVNDDPDPSPDYYFWDDHGTSCAGIIGAARNGVCGVGIAYNVFLGGECTLMHTCTIVSKQFMLVTFHTLRSENRWIKRNN